MHVLLIKLPEGTVQDHVVGPKVAFMGDITPLWGFSFLLRPTKTLSVCWFPWPNQEAKLDVEEPCTINSSDANRASALATENFWPNI